MKGNFSSVKHLLGHGARSTESCCMGKTALLHAEKKIVNFDVVQYLLSSEGGASITGTNDKGKTALLLASQTIHKALAVPRDTLIHTINR
jgi:ankyrin repeat protein